MNEHGWKEKLKETLFELKVNYGVVLEEDYIKGWSEFVTGRDHSWSWELEESEEMYGLQSVEISI